MARLLSRWIKCLRFSLNISQQDVTSFTLPDSPVEYFIKLRPGTKEFLKEASKKYEMHIYTMGTRNYAQAVAKIIDPDQSYFKERILSRDESGSFVAKSIQRLFPCDQSMVVVVDDRGDVWHWSPNLIKVHPYNFFVGIGDINEPGKPSVPETENGGVVADLSSTSAATPVTLPQQASQLPTTGTTPEGETDPLLEEFLSTATGTPLIGGSLLPPGQTSAIPTSLDTEETVHEETDNELARVRRLLNEIHSSYYKSLLDDGDFHQEPDVRIILPDMRRTILRGVSVVFSGVIPLGTDPTS